MNTIQEEPSKARHGSLKTEHPCPLCTGTAADELERVPFSRIWRALAVDLCADFSEDVIGRHTPGQETRLLECRGCGLQYFAPACPGDDEFYGELTTTASGYYSSEKWDFQAAAGVILPVDRVLDIGCGTGRFLEIMRDRGVQATGIDMNPASIDMAAQKGLSAYCVDLFSYSRGHGEHFDVVTAFQVIEHLAEVEPFVRDALRCLKPGGKLILTVPNRLRRFRDPFEPLDCPPHHLSRWTTDQFYVLAEIMGCRMVTVRYEPASMHDCRALIRRKITREGRSEPSWARAAARAACGPTLYSLYARMGWLDRWRMWRMSIMFILEKTH